MSDHLEDILLQLGKLCYHSSWGGRKEARQGMLSVGLNSPFFLGRICIEDFIIGRTSYEASFNLVKSIG